MWVRLDDKFHSHPKVLEAGDAAAGLYARSLAYCGDHLTDGFVPSTWLRQATKPATIKAVTEAGFWRAVAKGEAVDATTMDDAPFAIAAPSDGFYIDDYLRFNPTRESVQTERERKRQAGKRGAQARWGNGKRDAEAMAPAIADGIGSSMPTTRPVYEEVVTAALYESKGVARERHVDAEIKSIE